MSKHTFKLSAHKQLAALIITNYLLYFKITLAAYNIEHKQLIIMHPAFSLRSHLPNRY